MMQSDRRFRWAWKKGVLSDLPTPETVAIRLNGGDQLPIDDWAITDESEIQQLLIITKWPAVADDFDEVMRVFGFAEFGRDHAPAPSPESGRKIFRQSLCQAWDDFWRYSDAYVDYELDLRRAPRLATSIGKAFEEFLETMELGNSLVGRWQPWQRHVSALDLKHEVEPAVRSLMNHLQAFESDGHERDNWPIIRPDRFLYLRLAEIYAFLLGGQPRFHDSGDRRGTWSQKGAATASDQKFVSFIKGCLKVFDWPDVDGGKDTALRGLVSLAPEYQDHLDGLAELNTTLRGRPSGASEKFVIKIHLFSLVMMRQAAIEL